MESILTSIKKLLGLPEEITEFDMDIILHINSVLSALTQIGIGPDSGFSISDSSATWNDFMGDDPLIASVKSYVYMKVRLLFDPPSNGSTMEAFNQLIAEFEWRFYVEMDNRRVKNG